MPVPVPRTEKIRFSYFFQGTLEYVDGKCCPVCKPKEECARKEINETMVVGECRSEHPVPRTVCRGSCESHADALFVEPFIETDCKCCKPVALGRRSIELNCGNSRSALNFHVTPWTKIRIKKHILHFFNFQIFEILTAIICYPSYFHAANNTVITHEYVEIEACACDPCPYNPFASLSTSAPQIKLTTIGG